VSYLPREQQIDSAKHFVGDFKQLLVNKRLAARQRLARSSKVRVRLSGQRTKQAAFVGVGKMLVCFMLAIGASERDSHTNN